MRDPRRVTVPFVLFAAALVASCGGPGRAAYLEAGCAECHGENLRGTQTAGPSLKGVGDRWEVESLLAYFRNPDSVAALDPRLREIRERYGEGMPPLKLADPIAREALAEYVLR
jgi:mono/diheme cytochrome c family protein